MQYEQEPDYDYMKSLFLKVLKDNNYENDSIFDWVKKCSSPKTHSTMVPPNNELFAKDEFKLNISTDKNKVVTPSNALANSTVNNNFTSKAVNTLQVNRDENSQIRKKFTINNNEHITSNVFKVNNNTPYHNSEIEIE